MHQSRHVNPRPVALALGSPGPRVRTEEFLSAKTLVNSRESTEAERMHSVRPRLNAAVEADSYVDTVLPLSL